MLGQFTTPSYVQTYSEKLEKKVAELDKKEGLAESFVTADHTQGWTRGQAIVTSSYRVMLKGCFTADHTQVWTQKSSH